VNDQLCRLAQRIREELKEHSQVTERVQEGWRRAQRSQDDYYLDGVALNLHSFYAGIERLFEMIAETVDGSVPQGANWHQLLVEQMAREIPDIRPAVLTGEAVDILQEYRGFRHLVRNVYAFKFDPLKVEKLVEGISVVFDKVREELLAFADFLEQKSQVNED
jgi:hypothetical protein